MKVVIGVLIYFVTSIIVGLILGHEFKKAREESEKYLNKKSDEFLDN